MKKRLVFFIVCSLLLAGKTMARVCEGSVVLLSQADISAFDCTHIEGNLTIGTRGPGGWSDIGTIRPLSILQSLTGGIHMQRNGSLRSLEGLENIKRIPGALVLDAQNGLVNLTGLTNLEYIGYGLTIVNNPGLVSLDGMPKLKVIGDSAVTSRASLGIGNNPNLASLDALSTVEVMPRMISITGIPKITNLDALANAYSLGSGELGFINISGNTSLRNVDGLHNFTAPIIELKIIGNTSLENLDGLKNVAFDGSAVPFRTNFFELYGNHSLTSACGAAAIWGNIKQNIYTRIWDNTPSTRSLDAIIDACQVCTVYHDGDLTLETQAQVDNVQYCEISGNLTIKDSETDPINNLIGLSGLTRVGGLNVSENRTLLSLNGLNQLTETTAGSVLVISNPVLKSTSGLENLVRVNKDLKFQRAPSLELVDLSSLSVVIGNISFYYNRLLGTLELPNLVAVNGTVGIKTNTTLNRLALPRLGRIKGALYIGLNHGLKDLRGFNWLSSLGGYLFIGNNAGLETIGGLSRLENLPDKLEIVNNVSLDNLDGLHNIKTVADDFILTGNNNLQDACAFEELLTHGHVRIGGDIIIDDNGDDSSSLMDLLTTCWRIP